jgi:hypothetical protein
VWDPARGVDLFKKGSEEVLARFLRMGPFDSDPHYNPQVHAQSSTSSDPTIFADFDNPPSSTRLASGPLRPASCLCANDHRRRVGFGTDGVIILPTRATLSAHLPTNCIPMNSEIILRRMRGMRAMMAHSPHLSLDLSYQKAYPGTESQESFLTNV